MLQKSWSQAFSDLVKTKKFLIVTGVGVTFGIGLAIWHNSKDKSEPYKRRKRLLLDAESNSDLGKPILTEANETAMLADNLSVTVPLTQDDPLCPSYSGEPCIQDIEPEPTSWRTCSSQTQSRSLSMQACQEFPVNQPVSTIKGEPKPDPEEEVLGLIKDFHQAATLDPSELKKKP
jgi:hypothetical protein